MSHSKSEQMDIGRQVTNHELSHFEAMTKYNVSSSSIDKYVRLYKDSTGAPTRPASKAKKTIVKAGTSSHDIEAYMAMSKEELINELILAKVNELRAKKGYEVKGAGANKEFIPLNRPSSKS